MNSAWRVLGGCAALGAALGLWPERAQAGIDACGDIHVEASAECEVVAPGASCEGMCTPVSVTAACSAQLAADCRAECDDLPSVDCSGRCEASCSAECSKLDPGEFDCETACEADCSGQCEARCEADEDSASCMASCQGSCSASCDASCDVDLPEADCEAGCEASCEGSCEVDANLDCQASCQARGHADCEAEVQGGCELDCRGREGALFCDGQYIDDGGNLDACVDALRAALDIEVEGHARGEAGCSDGKGCRAEGEARASLKSDCSVAMPGARRDFGWPGLAVALVGLSLRRRRSRHL